MFRIHGFHVSDKFSFAAVMLTLPDPTALSVLSTNIAAARSPSYGAVWTVGGTAPPYHAAVDDGRGHYLRSGTNARLVTANFSTARTRAKEDFERHQGMLADALRIDQISRVLDFRKHAASVQMTHREGQQSRLPLKTLWTGSQWVSPEKPRGWPPP